MGLFYRCFLEVDGDLLWLWTGWLSGWLCERRVLATLSVSEGEVGERLEEGVGRDFI